MTEAHSRTGVRRYRSRVEAEQVVEEFKASGLTRREFCKQHSVAVNTLNRYISRYSSEPSQAPRLLPVEVAKPDRAGSGITVVLARGRRLELTRGFDASTLVQAVSVLDRL
jgi:hypothetical protein